MAIGIRGIGEIAPADLSNLAGHPSRVDLDVRTDEYGVRRALVTIALTPRDNELWNFMDATMQQVANLFANGQPMEVIQSNRDGLGTTHHETGTLWMGTDPTKSVTDEDGRFHHTENLYAAGPCLFPSIGSPNPMLTGTQPPLRCPRLGARADFAACFIEATRTTSSVRVRVPGPKSREEGVFLSCITGRRAIRSSSMKTLTVRLPELLAADIEAESRGRGISKSDVVRERLRLAAGPGRRAPAALETIADLIGSVEGLPADLSARKKFYLRATGYGRKRPR